MASCARVLLGVAALGAAACGDDSVGDGDASATAATMSTSAGTEMTGVSATESDAGTASASETGTVSGTMSASDSEGTTATTMGTSTGETTTTTTTTSTSTDGTTAVTSTDATTDTTGDTGGPCMVSMDCELGEVCVAGMCVPGEGSCEEYGDCQGDTYCCKDGCLPPGEDQGVCIPFGLEPEGDVNEMCSGPVKIGLFEPEIQCEWTAPPMGDPYPNHVNVLTTPMVAALPANGNDTTELIIVTYNYTDGGAQSGWGSDPNYFGVIRILDGRTCQQIGNVHDPNNKMIAASPPAIGDLDGDGNLEIVTHRAGTGVIAYTWDDNNKAYKTMWVETNTGIVNATRWDGPSIHDLDDDGFPEVISGSGVFAGDTGTRLNPGQLISGAGANVIPVLADVDGDGLVELIAGAVHSWNMGMSKWEYAYPGGPSNRHYAVADFGTPGPTPADFDAKKLDGIAEIVSVGGNLVRLHTLEGQLILQGAIGSGGPPTVGDFDNDGFPEIAAAGGTYYAVYDLDCKDGGMGCVSPYVRWQKTSQDASSATTGSSIFDFEGDGKAEAVYADECFTRVYEGLTGEVLYSSYRTSCTWYENPVVADVDSDDNTEIVVPSNANCNVGCPAIDPIHRGTRCEGADDCGSGVCDSGFCRCTMNAECPADHICTTPLNGTPGTGNTCRAQKPPGSKKTGVRVLRDTLDRWASSRQIWNQHAYAVTNDLRMV
ncbi:MAG: VCBS repeat-containing protein [Nannocystaceae bacterium]